MGPQFIILFFTAIFSTEFSKSVSNADAVYLNVLQGSSTSIPTLDSVLLESVPFPFFWIQEPKDFKVLSGNEMTITAAKGTDIYTFVDGNYYINSAPKLLFTPDSNFIFSAKITPSFDGVYDGGAILLYSDSLNWAKLLFEKLDENSFIIGSSVISDKKTDDKGALAG
jgi:uncharacterized protein